MLRSEMIRNNLLDIVGLKLQQDAIEIDSLTVSCRNCARGVTFNATKDGTLNAVSSEHLRCPKTVTAPLGATIICWEKNNKTKNSTDFRLPSTFHNLSPHASVHQCSNKC